MVAACKWLLLALSISLSLPIAPIQTLQFRKMNWIELMSNRRKSRSCICIWYQGRWTLISMNSRLEPLITDSLLDSFLRFSCFFFFLFFNCSCVLFYHNTPSAPEYIKRPSIAFGVSLWQNGITLKAMRTVTNFQFNEFSELVRSVTEFFFSLQHLLAQKYPTESR